MASNREERLQMRQRGAGTRRIKEVNFGFSFGLAPAPVEPFQTASQPDVDTTIEPPAPPQVPSAAKDIQPHLLSPERQLPSSQDHGPLPQTPGAARNPLPEPPSTFDIPEDNGLDLGRSGKRRKIETPTQSPRISVDPEVTLHEDRDSPILENGIQSSAPVPSDPIEHRDEYSTMQSTTDIAQTERTSQEARDEHPARVSNSLTAKAPAMDDDSPDQTDANQRSPKPQQEPSGPYESPAVEDTTKGKRKRRGSSADQRRSRSVEEPETANENTQPPTPQELSLASHDKYTGPESPKFQPEKRPRGRPRTSAQLSPATDKGSAQNEVPSTESVPGESIPTHEQPTKGVWGRKASEPAEVPIANESSNSQPLEQINAPEGDVTGKYEGSHQLRQWAKKPNGKQKQVGRSTKKASKLLENAGAPGPAGEKRKWRKRSDHQAEPELEPEAETEVLKELKPASEKRNRRSKSEREPEAEPETEPQREPEATQESKPVAEKRKGRKRLDQEQIPEPEPEAETEIEPLREPEAPNVSKTAVEKRKGRKRLDREQIPEPEPEAEAEIEPLREPEAPNVAKAAVEKRKLKKRSDQAELEPEAEPEPEPERGAETPKEPKPASEKKKRRRELDQEPEPEPDRQPEPEASKEPKPAAPPKRGRGRPSLSSQAPEATQSDEDPAAQNEHGEGASRTTRRKPRQPRGETVPVTVHRLVNVASLGGHIQPSEVSTEEEEPVDEFSMGQKAQVPSRGGVNVADVLSQICRETLEKTLTTLKNGISNEGNAARRSEWTTKKKAVEEFGTELEGRLFELSEMLDSNFGLGVKLKKAKREMMDMRSRLYQLRKEREGIALQIDAVRKKHSEEEHTRLARSNINNSLHSLNLALERSQNRPEGDLDDESSSGSSLTVGLEFMLRSVADNVSTRAPGAQGGLLSQIKAFNAQLEAAARTLES
ncbi:hypothetical protein BDV28DRAFT_147558 [Aspergillus coremiiformis]|uniref:Inner kinetochore subunit AME1 domain-containing protein n=1 Tax=Aspergillus coremiiformis TaxID=138285 RepID=A0A5N6Z8P4_9EURO|nr:hypothetical protein BDV28DRAFT_147558 [Aspergillus coremiiformis]